MKPAGQRLRRQLTAGFPGEIAGASLKRQVPRALLAGRVRFPGEIAGASLKPAHMPPGLVQIRDSPAKSPGPH